MAIDLGTNRAVEVASINALLKDSGAVEVNNKDVDE